MTTQLQKCTKKGRGTMLGKRTIHLTPTLLLLMTSLSWSNEQTGTMTQVEGSVKIFSHPSKILQKESGAPHALFEGEYFLVADAKVGDRVEKGNIVRTAPGSKARVVYENGDQFNVGPATAYRVTWNEGTSKNHTQVTLAYGKLRGIIEKGGPRSRLQVRTKTAVMGVRGTDFFIAQNGTHEATEVSIIRGEVEVSPQDSKAKPVAVQAGYSAAVTMKETTTNQKVDPKVELRKTTQEEFVGIQKSSTLSHSNRMIASAPETQKTVEVLEQKATATVLKDIQTHDKKLYATLEKQSEGDLKITVDKINQAAIANLIKEAPKAPPKRKPYQSEMEDIEDGAYEKYFKQVD
jgi:hypothetical protein